RDWGWTIEMQVRALQEGLRVTEIPVRYRRRVGESKISGTLAGSFRAGRKILWVMWALRRPGRQDGPNLSGNHRPSRSDARQRDPHLVHVLAGALRIRLLALLVGLEEQNLRQTFAAVDLGRQRRRVRDLERQRAFPQRLERRDVADDAAARVAALAD